MRLSLESILVLEAIARNGSFALAAKELHKVPSALTYTINKLEQQLGIAIFDRQGHKAKLTAIGKYLLEESKQLILVAEEIEQKIAMQKTGWESKIIIAYDQLIPFERLIPLFERFYDECPGVSLKITAEVLGGCWEALIDKRADIAIGVTGDPPIREGFSTRPMGQIDFSLVACPNHKITQEKNIDADIIKQYRIIAVADSAHKAPPRTTGILPSQDILTVSSFYEKILLMKAGLGIGYLPTQMAKRHIEKNELVEITLSDNKASGIVSYAWVANSRAKAKNWFVKQLSDKKICKSILS